MENNNWETLARKNRYLGKRASQCSEALQKAHCRKKRSSKTEDCGDKRSLIVKKQREMVRERRGKMVI